MTSGPGWTDHRSTARRCSPAGASARATPRYVVPVRVAVLIKQVPRFESMALGPDGRLVREGLESEMNPYCRRAVSKGVELARQTGGTCTVLTLGPPAAADALREAVAWGADAGILITDRAFAGSDTLATARALAAALRREGPWDLVLAGRNSVDADTGQVGPEVAQLLGLPFLAGVRSLQLDGSTVRAHLEHDDGWADATVTLPALLTCAERLCEPAKVSVEGRSEVPAERIATLTAAHLGSGPWGQDGSPTRVGNIRVLDVQRDHLVLSGPVRDQVARAIDLLVDAGALGSSGSAPANTDYEPGAAVVAGGRTRGEAVAEIAVLIEPNRQRVTRELLGGAARLANEIGGRVVALAPAGALDPDMGGCWGADEVVSVRGSLIQEDLAEAVGRWCEGRQPWAVLAPGTMWGREIASRLAARLGAGLTGDAVDLAVDRGRMVGWKPAFGGQLVAAITATSTVQLATVRPGMLTLLRPRPPRPVVMSELTSRPDSRVVLLRAGRDDDLDGLATAKVVIGVGTGVNPGQYHLLAPLQRTLGAELAATRKVTDNGWQPRSRQVGLTGRSISPRLYMAVGILGKFNHMVGVRGAGKILAINQDPDALVFKSADIGIVADWKDAVPLLNAAIEGPVSAEAS
jgi:electron transfer flavoprotein alpha subunit